jgi:polyhydroxyalkanoate synthesis regulator phasin
VGIITNSSGIFIRIFVFYLHENINKTKYHTKTLKIKWIMVEENLSLYSDGFRLMKKTYNFETILVLILVLVYSENSLAQEDVSNKGLDKLSAIDLEKRQVEKIVERMVRTGRLSKEQGENARREMASISSRDIEIVKKSVARSIASTENN